MLNYNVKFLTSDDTLHVKNSDFKTFKYETKKRVDESVYDSGKRSFCERRSGHWRAPRPRQIRQLEVKLRDRSIIACEWTTQSLLTLVFSSGAIAYLTVKPDTLDIIQILFDRYCVGKLSGHLVTGVAISQTCLLFTHADKLATLITFGRSSTSTPCRISDRDPCLQTIELGGGARRCDRKISCCDSKAGPHVLVWSSSTVDPAPWSPIIEDHANLHLYSINGQHISLVAYHQLENEALLAEVSQQCDSTIHIVEQVGCQKNGVSLHWTQYEMANEEGGPKKLSSWRSSETRVSVPAAARTVRRARGPRLVAACLDGSLHIVHASAGLTHSTRAGFIANEVWWAGDLVVAAENGRLQCFDQALSLLHHHAKCFDLTSYLRETKHMQVLATRPSKGGPTLVVSFAGGPLAILHITHPKLLTSWIRSGRSANAVALLRAMDWEEDGMECLWAVNKLVCVALRSGQSALSEEDNAQAALGAFLAPLTPLGTHATRYAPPVHELARKFHHHLLRRGRIEKALSLAVDLGAWDLAADSRWMATRRALPHLAQEAATLAAHYGPDSDCSESCSQCSSQSYSDDDTTTSEVKTNPPPLPRVSLPNVVSVPITQSEHSSTNSIRPNLHQYLDRDDTIWTQNVEDTYVKIVNPDRIRPILTQNSKRMENLRLGASISSLAVINEVPCKNSTVIDVPRALDSKNSNQFRGSYHTELREEPVSFDGNMFRYHNNNYHPGLGDKNKSDSAADRSRQEKSKVKFSDTVTIAVVSEPAVFPESARELADSLPLCPPHKYLSAFTPHARVPSSTNLPPPSPNLPNLANLPNLPRLPPAGTTLDYVEV